MTLDPLSPTQARPSQVSLQKMQPLGLFSLRFFIFTARMTEAWWRDNPQSR